MTRIGNVSTGSLGALHKDTLRTWSEQAAPLQRSARHHICYLSEQPEDILSELLDLDAEEGVYGVINDTNGALLGWMIGDIDLDVNVCWWLGPFITTGDASAWEQVMNVLYPAVESVLPEQLTAQNFGIDVGFEWLKSWGCQNGFDVGEASSTFMIEPIPSAPEISGVRDISPADSETIGALHDKLFPSTYMSASQIVMPRDEERVHLVLEAEGQSIGYIAGGRQPSGDGYIDYVGVFEEHRRSGHARTLAAALVERLRQRGCTRLQATVATANHPARTLCASHGMKEGRRIMGLRKQT